MGDDPAPHDSHRISARTHFTIGAIIVAVAALLSSSLHGRSIFRNFQLLNLDAFFFSQLSPVDASNIVVVPITEDDYQDRTLFAGRSPLDITDVENLILACVTSGANVIGIDLDTSNWRAEDRQTVLRKALKASPNVRLVWALNGWVEETTNRLTVQHLKGLDNEHHDCEAVPASIPDDYGVVRGYLPGVRADQNGAPVAVPAMASLLYSLGRNRDSGCLPPNWRLLNDGEELFVNYSGGGARFVHITATTVLKAASGVPWRNSNPLRGRVVVIGGTYREARDKYITPAGYLDGVDILALTVLSASHETSQLPVAWFVVIDLMVGFSLLTATWYLQNAWVLLLSFLLIPVTAILGSFVIFERYGYFASFVPVIAGVFVHHLVEHTVEHWRLTREIGYLRSLVK